MAPIIYVWRCRSDKAEQVEFILGSPSEELQWLLTMQSIAWGGGETSIGGKALQSIYKCSIHCNLSCSNFCLVCLVSDLSWCIDYQRDFRDSTGRPNFELSVLVRNYWRTHTTKSGTLLDTITNYFSICFFFLLFPIPAPIAFIAL